MNFGVGRGVGNRYGTPRPDLKKWSWKGSTSSSTSTRREREVVKRNLPTRIDLSPAPFLKVLKERLINRGGTLWRGLSFDCQVPEGIWKRPMDTSMSSLMIARGRLEKLKSIIVAERCRRGKNIILEANMKQWRKRWLESR